MTISRMTSTLAALTIAGGTLVSGASAATANSTDAVASTADRASAYSAEACANATTIEVRFDDAPSEVHFLDTATGTVTDETTTNYSGCDEDAATGGGDTFSTQAVEAYGLAQLTRADPNYFASDANGSFRIQATHSSGYPISWAMTLTPAARAIATGPVTAQVDRTPPNCSYSKVDVPDYYFHSSCRGHTAEAVYVLNGVYTYPCQVGGRTCDAELIWNARYRIIT